MPDYTNGLVEYLRRNEESRISNPQAGVSICKTPIGGEMFYTAELPLETLLQIPATTDSSAVHVTAQVIKRLNDVVADPSKSVEAGDKLVLLFALKNGSVKYHAKVYDVGLLKSSGTPELVAYSDWKDKNPRRTLTDVTGLPAGLDVRVQVQYHHKPWNVAESEIAFLTNPDLLKEEPQPDQPKPDETSSTVALRRRSKSARFTLDDSASTEETARPGVVPPVAKSYSTPGPNTEYPGPSNGTQARTETTRRPSEVIRFSGNGGKGRRQAYESILGELAEKDRQRPR